MYHFNVQMYEGGMHVYGDRTIEYTAKSFIKSNSNSIIISLVTSLSKARMYGEGSRAIEIYYKFNVKMNKPIKVYIVA